MVKQWILKVLAFIMLILGLGLIILPGVLNKSHMETSSKLINEYDSSKDSIRDTEYEMMWREAREYNIQLAQKEKQFIMNEREINIVNSLLNPYGTGMIGYINIPKIEIYLPIFHGTEERVLQSGCGLMYGSSLPTGDKDCNSIITAHSGLVKAKMFTDINKLAAGDTFYITILNKEFEYKVIDKIVTDPDDLSKLEIKPDKNYVTLYTCTPPGLNTQRLLVIGELDRSE